MSYEASLLCSQVARLFTVPFKLPTEQSYLSSKTVIMENTTISLDFPGPASVTKSVPWWLAVLIVYPWLQQYLRYQRLNKMKKKYGYKTRESLAKMTDTEAWEIMNFLAELEFPMMFHKGI